MPEALWGRKIIARGKEANADATPGNRRTIFPLARGNGRGWHEVTGEGCRLALDYEPRTTPNMRTKSRTDTLCRNNV